MKQLIALVAIAAGKYASEQPVIEAGAAFPAPDDLAAKMIDAGDARLDEASPDGDKTVKNGKKVKVRLLVDSALGNANDLIEVAAGELKALERDGVADGSKEAVAYAQTLPQNKPG